MKISNRSKAMFATLAIAAGLLTAAPVAANAEPSGQYYYSCLYGDGNSYTLAHGVKTKTCHGTYLKEYIGGSLVASYHIVGHGATSKPSKKYAWCVLAIIGTGASAVAEVVAPEGTIAWVTLASDAIHTIGDCIA